MNVAMHGFLVGLSLIIAIGPQNALVLKQGLKRQHVGIIVAICALSDVILISAGTGGVGAILAHAPWVLTALTYGGAAYLIYFAYTCFRDALHPQALDDSTEDDSPAGGSHDVAPPSHAAPAGSHAPSGTAAPSAHRPGPQAVQVITDAEAQDEQVIVPAKRTRTRAPWVSAAVSALALTWLNPGAYIDTVIMVGGLANQEGPTGRWMFAAGAILASLVWFPTLGYGAAKLSRPLSKPAVWRVLNVAIGFIMLGITARLLMH